MKLNAQIGWTAMLTYLTGFRAAEAWAFAMVDFSNDRICVVSAKRKMGKDEITKAPEYLTRLRFIAARPMQVQ